MLTSTSGYGCTSIQDEPGGEGGEEEEEKEEAEVNACEFWLGV